MLKIFFSQKNNKYKTRQNVSKPRTKNQIDQELETFSGQSTALHWLSNIIAQYYPTILSRNIIAYWKKIFIINIDLLLAQ